jgi:hypothetical protein
MNKILIYFFLIILSFNSYGQSVEEDSKYFPTSLGLIWNYERPNGGFSESVEVIKVEGIESYFFSKIFLEDIMTPTLEVYTRVNNMILKTAYAGGLLGDNNLEYLNPAEIILKLPIKVGDKWNSEKKGWFIEREVLKKHDKLWVNGKVYSDVIEVKEKKGNLDQRFFYAKRIGLVQILIKNSTTNKFNQFLILNE